MGNVCKAGSWVFRINPSDSRQLQRASVGSSSFSHLWSAPNGERIVDLSPRGDDLEISTDRHTYIRSKSGNVKEL